MCIRDSSYLGRVAAVMLGSTETTFYTIAVYFGAQGGGQGIAGSGHPHQMCIRDRAKSIALTHAGVSEDQVSGLQVQQDQDDGRLEYEVEFRSGGMEYEYTIDGGTGQILEYDREQDD